MDNMPIIRLEVDRMKHTLITALSDYQARLDSQLLASIEAYCTHDNIARVIDDQVRNTLDLIIREEVRNWFSYGAGRAFIRQAVQKRLDELDLIYKDIEP